MLNNNTCLHAVFKNGLIKRCVIIELIFTAFLKFIIRFYKLLRNQNDSLIFSDLYFWETRFRSAFNNIMMFPKTKIVQIRGVPCWSIWAITLTPVFHNSKILPLKQYFSAINYYHKHLNEKTGGSAIAQIVYDGTPLIECF